MPIAPKVDVTATQRVISAQAATPMPILTCSVEENSFPVNQIKWLKGSREVVQTQVSQTLDFHVGSTSTDGASIFGTYTCEASRRQNTASNRIHIAERGKVTSIYELIHSFQLA